VISADIRVANHDIFSAEHTQPEDAPSGARALMFIGPTGVGKTTTIAKLAARAIQNGRRVGIISLDTYRIGAIEQVRIYAKIMGIPLSVVSNGKEFKNSLSTFAGTREMIFIDTSGRNPHDNEYIREMLENVGIGFPLELHLLMSANYDDEFMVDTFRSYGKLPVDYLSITKIDESVRFGSLYNLLLIYQRPVAFLTTGQKVPDDIESASVDRLVNLILRKRCYAC
jgi:flagellar biosynthesis protein FlhF